MLLEHRSKSWPIRLDHGIALGSEKHPVLQSISPRVASRQQSITRRRAARGWRVRIRKSDTHPGQPFHLRRVNLIPVRIASEVLIGAGVAHAHVIRHHEYDIRAIQILGGGENGVR